MNKIQWIHNNRLHAGTTLRDLRQLENNNMALHTGGKREDIIINRKRLSEDIGIDISQWVFAQQTHSDHIYKVELQDAGKGAFLQTDGIPDCDALYTKEKNIAIGVFHADCVPILLYDPFSEIICAIHSGWLGTTKEITRKALEHLIQAEGVNPANMKAYIGPAISYESFEVGMDVIEKVKNMSFDTAAFITYASNDKAYVNTKGLNAAMLEACGISKDNITINLNDTFMKNDALFSYRRNHACGRHLSYIVMLDANDSDFCCNAL